MPLELELTKTEIHYDGLVHDLTGSREETLEMIVPDVCPDMLRVADTCGFCCLSRRELTDSGALLAGKVDITILYLPEEGEGLCHLETEIPFQHRYECGQIGEGGHILAAAEITLAETRILNPRKVLLRVELREQVQIYEPGTLSLCSGLEEAQPFGLQQMISHHQASVSLTPGEKTFPFEEELTLPGGHTAVEILRLQPAVSCHESRVIGSKLVLKGSVLLHMLFRGEDGGVYTADYDLPFSQMLETGSAGDGAAYSLALHVVECRWGSLSADGRMLTVSLELAAHAVFFETVSAGVLTDVYSTRCPVTARREVWHLQRSREPVTRRQTIREFVPLEAAAPRTILDTHLELGQSAVRREGDSYELSAPARATVLYVDEDGQYGTLTHTFSVSMRQAAGEDGTISCRCVPERLEAVHTAAGMELRGTVEFSMQMTELFQVDGVAGLELDQEHPLDHSGQPSIVLRRPMPGETLWALAKRYGTTCQEICAANGLAPEQEPAVGQMLLIPRVR